MIETNLIVRLVLFTLAMLPLLIENIRHSTVSNRNNAILFVAGLAFAGYAIANGLRDPSLGMFGGWLLIVVGALGLFVAKVVPGGIAKTLVALSPWLDLEQMLWVITIAGIGAGLAAKLAGGRAALVAPLYLATCAVWIFNWS